MSHTLDKSPASRKRSDLLAENQDLRARLQEAEAALNEIRPGSAASAPLPDDGNESLRNLPKVDRSYRLLLDELKEGGLIAATSGRILHINRSLAQLLKALPAQVIGSRLQDWVDGEAILAAADLFKPSKLEASRREIRLRALDGTQVTVYVAAFDLPGYDGMDAVGMVATDLSSHHEPIDELVESEKATRELLAASDRSRLALLSVVEDQSEVERSLRERTSELLQLYELSRALAAAENLEQVLDVIGQAAVRMIHVTFARIALLDGDHLVVRAAYPVRVLEHDLLVSEDIAIADSPHTERALTEHQTVLMRSDEPGVTAAERLSLMLDLAASLCIVPLRVGDSGQHVSQDLGVLMLGEARDASREPLTTEKMRLAQSIGDQAAAAIRRMSLYEQTGRRLRHLVALRTIDTAISGSLDLRTVLNVLLEQSTLQLGADAASLLLLDPSTYTLEHFASRGLRSESARHARIRLGEGPIGRAALEGRHIRIPDLRTAPDEMSALSQTKGEDFVSYFAVPILVKGQTRGLLEILHRRPLHPDQEWFDFLDTMTNQAALAIENAELFRDLERANVELSLAYDATIEGWSRALDLRDRETEGHTQRVADLCLTLWRKCGGGEAEMRQIRWGALLHDIGKMGVPDGILLKPGPLTDEEWKVMRQHPTLAYQMLAPIHYLRAALDIPYCHHEKWDGTGYPRGLQGENIPKAARVFAIVDVWDALTSDRPYRPAWSPQKALQYIREQSGKHFDPDIVTTFLTLHE